MGKVSPHSFATLERTAIKKVDPADLQVVSTRPDEQSDDGSLGSNSLFVPQTTGCSHRPLQHLNLDGGDGYSDACVRFYQHTPYLSSQTEVSDGISVTMEAVSMRVADYTSILRSSGVKQR
jgi:hypothetical protein